MLEKYFYTLLIEIMKTWSSPTLPVVTRNMISKRGKLSIRSPNVISCRSRLKILCDHTGNTRGQEDQDLSQWANQLKLTYDIYSLYNLDSIRWLKHKIKYLWYVRNHHSSELSFPSKSYSWSTTENLTSHCVISPRLT